MLRALEEVRDLVIKDDIHAVVEEKVGPNATIYLAHFLLYTDRILKDLVFEFDTYNTYDSEPVPLTHLTSEVMRQTNTTRHFIFDLDELEEVERLYKTRYPEGTLFNGWRYFLRLLDYVRGLKRNTNEVIRVVIWIEE